MVASVRHGLREPFAGGLERHTADLARRLREAGHAVTVFASGQSDPELGVEAICAADSELDLSPAARRDVSMLSKRFMVEHDAYLGLMLRLAESDFDVIHDNSLHYLPLSMSRSVPAPVVKVLHTPPTPWLESALRYRAPTSVLVSVSRSNAVRWSTPVDRVVHNGIDLGEFAPSGGEIRPRAIWSGRIVPEKGAAVALRAAHLADMDLVLAGPISDEGYFRREVEPLLDERRRHLGHLRAAALVAELAASAVSLVTPLWDEPYGLVVVESLACGTPVAGIARGALPELLTADTGVMAEAADPQELARCLVEASKLDRAACRQRACSLADGRRMAAQYVEVYEAAAA